MRIPPLKQFLAHKDDRHDRRALTLIEVVVALVLLASLLVGMVTAYSAHHRQGIRAHRKRHAAAAADKLLTQWFLDANPNVPRSGQGLLPGPSPLIWRTEIVHRNVIETLPVEIVRLQIFSETALFRGQSGAENTPSPLAQVDVMLPVPVNPLIPF